MRRLVHDTAAVAAAEMALVLPMIAFIFLNVADVGLYIFTKMQVDLAAQEAVGAARVLCNTAAKLPPTTGTCPGYDTAMSDAAKSTSLGTGVTIANTASGYYCSKSDQSLVAVTSTTANCSGPVPGSTAKPGIYITTTASYTYAPIFPGASVASALTSPITRASWIRLQ